MDLTQARRRVTALQATRTLAVSKLTDERKTSLLAQLDVATAMEATRIVQEIAETIQREAHSRISQVVSRCLSAVFDEPYEFEIVFEQKRGRTEADLRFVRGGMVVDYRCIGGGVVDVAAFALRLAALLLTKPALRRLLILDEPMRCVSKHYVPKMRELFLVLAEEMGVQFIIVTHNEVLAVGTVVELT